MKKLKYKVFLVIFVILSLFLLSILFIFNYQNYENEKEMIKSHLMRIDDIHIKDESKEPINNLEDNQKIFMDIIVYTVLLDGREIKDIISHTEQDVNKSEVYDFALSIIDDNNYKNFQIGNLYFDKYSYLFRANNNLLIIVDNTNVRNNLLNMLRTSILIYILLEIIIILISLKLTSWIIKPVIDSFNKQKQFIADASHELKTPLSIIMASAEVLEKEPKSKKWLSNIKSESERMYKLITSLLDLAKLENDNEIYNYSQIDLSKAIQKSVLTFESLTYEKNLVLTSNITSEINIKGNLEQIKQLMAILLDNALSHTYKNGDIIVNLFKARNEIILEVKNKGEAISKEEENKIFERFYRGDSSRNRNDDRYGLGLAIAKSIVLNHQGKISASSSNGYTTFKIIFKPISLT